MMAGTGVSFDVDIIERRVGSCPSRAPTKNNLDDVKIDPLTDPKQDKETNTGITHDTAPRTCYKIIIKKKLIYGFIDKASEYNSELKE